MIPIWHWETEHATWSVELQVERAQLYWVGADKPRPGVPYSALGGGAQTQPFEELLATGRSRYTCPPHILAEVIAAVRALVTSAG
jgi:hypothetical protein